MSSPITFNAARSIVRNHLLDSWTAAHGQLHIAEHGFESPTHWRVIAESRAAPVDEDEPEAIAPEPMPDRAYLVSKETGDLETLPLTPDNVERLSVMTPYGEARPD